MTPKGTGRAPHYIRLYFDRIFFFLSEGCGKSLDSDFNRFSGQSRSILFPNSLNMSLEPEKGQPEVSQEISGNESESKPSVDSPISGDIKEIDYSVSWITYQVRY